MHFLITSWATYIAFSHLGRFSYGFCKVAYCMRSFILFVVVVEYICFLTESMILCLFQFIASEQCFRLVQGHDLAEWSNEFKPWVPCLGRILPWNLSPNVWYQPPYVIGNVFSILVWNVLCCVSLTGMFFESTRGSSFDESPITHPSYAKQSHPMYCFRRSASELQVLFLCSERWGYCFLPCWMYCQHSISEGTAQN